MQPRNHFKFMGLACALALSTTQALADHGGSSSPQLDVVSQPPRHELC